MGFPQPPEGSAIQKTELPDAVELRWPTMAVDIRYSVGMSPRARRVMAALILLFLAVVLLACARQIIIGNRQPLMVIGCAVMAFVWMQAVIAYFRKDSGNINLLRLTATSLEYYSGTVPYSSKRDDGMTFRKDDIQWIGWKHIEFRNGLFLKTTRGEFELGDELSMDDLAWLRQVLIGWHEPESR